MIGVKILGILSILLTILEPTCSQNGHMFPEIRQRNYMTEHKQSTAVDRRRETKRSNDDLRLPIAWTPVSYFIRLKPFINTVEELLEGYIEIVFIADEAALNITLHIEEIYDYQSSITLHPIDNPRQKFTFIEHTYDSETHFYVGYFDTPLVVGTTYKLTMDYNSTINNFLAGLYISSYINEEGETVKLATTQMQPSSARRAFPCFDEPAMKATFQIEMGRENFNGAIANMPLISSRPMDDEPGWTWDLFDVSPKMSSYLVAFVVSNFVSISDVSENGVLFRIWAREAVIDQGAYSLDIGPKMLTYFEEYYDIPFPLPKSDMIALPDFDAGAMENWGLITYRENNLLYDSQYSSASNKQRVAQVISHELAHMWFGDLVSMLWWNDLWLNEGFATYVEYLGIDAVEPEMDMQVQYVSRDLQSIFQDDSLITAHPLRMEVSTTQEIGSIFDGITYSKGSAVIRMMNFFLTEETFRKGLTRYLNEFAYDNAQQEDLFRNLDIQAKEDGTLSAELDVQRIMETWTLQEGFPVISVVLNGDRTATLTQERYLQTSDGTEAPLKYWVPITHTSGNSNPDFTKTFPTDWMSPSDDEVTIRGLIPNEDWYLFNVQQVSYYRVNYEETNWRALRDQLISDHTIIDIRNRAQIIDDSFNLALSGHLIYDIPFEISAYLTNEEHYVPWDSALSNVAYIEEMFTRSAGYASLKNYLQSLIIPIYDKVGFGDSLSDEHLIQLLRSSVVSWACDLRHQPCLDDATELFATWMETPDDFTVVSPNLKSGVYCTAVAQGGDAEWDFAWDRYITIDISTEIDYLLFAMSCSKDVPTLAAYLDSAFIKDGAIRLQDVYKVFHGVAANDVGRDIAWDYLTNKYKEIAEFYGGSYVEIQHMSATASREFNTEKDLIEMNLFKELLAVETINLDIYNGALEKVENNIKWMNSNYNAITNWLDENDYNSK